MGASRGRILRRFSFSRLWVPFGVPTVGNPLLSIKTTPFWTMPMCDASFGYSLGSLRQTAVRQATNPCISNWKKAAELSCAKLLPLLCLSWATGPQATYFGDRVMLGLYWGYIRFILG